MQTLILIIVFLVTLRRNQLNEQISNAKLFRREKAENDVLRVNVSAFLSRSSQAGDVNEIFDPLRRRTVEFGHPQH